MTVGLRYFTVALFLYILVAFTAESVTGQDIEGLKKQKPFSITGTLGGSLMFYNVTGKPASRKPFIWMLTGSPTVSLYGIQFPFSFVVSEQQREFRQPFNKFGVSPYYKWIKLHLGYRNINWSPYSMAGHTVYGAGFELTPGKFQIGFIYGRLLKAIDPNLQTYELNSSYVTTPAFERKVWSMKFGYGTENNHAGILILKGWDDPGSLSGEIPASTLAPAENTILTFLTHQRLGSKFHFDLQASQSIYTNDIRSTLPDSSSYLPLDIVPGLYTKNATTYSSAAIESSVGYSGKRVSLNVRFKQIDPGYRSMGAYFFQNDLRNLTIEPAWHTANQKVNLSGSLGFQRDNLNNELTSTTHRTIGSFSLSANPAAWYSANMSYSNYDLGQSRGMTPVDSLYEISQTTQNISLNQNVNIQGKSLTQNLMLALNYQKLNDKNNHTANFNSYSSFTLMGNYLMSFINSGITASLGYNHTLFRLQASDNRISGPSVSVTKTLFKNKLSLVLADQYFKNSLIGKNGSGDRIYGINRISFRGTLKPSKHHRFYIRFYVNKGNAKTTNVTSFTERKGDIGYVYSF